MSILKRTGTCMAVVLIAGFVAIAQGDPIHQEIKPPGIPAGVLPGNVRQSEQVEELVWKALNQLPSAEKLESAAEGLAKESHAEILTLEQVFTLALVRFRDKRTALAPKLDPRVP
jgi:hypothetical protein